MEEITLGQSYPKDVRKSHIVHPVKARPPCGECGKKMKPIIEDGSCVGYKCRCGFRTNWVAGVSHIVDG